MEEDARPWNALSRASGHYSYTLYCANMRPRCGHSAEVDVEAFLTRVGDRTWEWIREHARCAACGHRGATLIVSPLHTGPLALDPQRQRRGNCPAGLEPDRDFV